MKMKSDGLWYVVHPTIFGDLMAYDVIVGPSTFEALYRAVGAEPD